MSTTNKPNLNFTNTQIAYSAKSNKDLIRGLLVLLTCREPLVIRADRILNLSKSILGQKLSNFLIRETFFKHFCAGETQAEALSTLTHLRKFGVGGILDFAAERDVIKEADSETITRQYDYESERVCDAHMANFITCVESAGDRGFAAVKITALGDAATIEKISRCVTEIRHLFMNMMKEQGLVDQPLTRTQFVHVYSVLFKDAEGGGAKLFENVVKTARERFHDDEHSRNDEIDMFEWLSHVTPREYVELSRKLKQVPKEDFVWTMEDTEKMDRMFGRLNKIANRAKSLSVRIMIDAEQTYFQPAIDALTLQLMRHHNVCDDGTDPVVFSTYQAYLKDAQDRLSFALKLSRRERWIFACKIVRGAYMVRERALAKEQNRPSPIHDTLEDTANCYLECCKLVLEHGEDTQLVVASHNRESILQIIDLMDKLGRNSNHVAFAQLYGMSDSISFALAANRQSVYKYLPFGPVQEVLPYLVRRAQENSSVVDGAKAEIKLILKEMARRVSLYFRGSNNK